MSDFNNQNRNYGEQNNYGNQNYGQQSSYDNQNYSGQNNYSNQSYYGQNNYNNQNYNGQNYYNNQNYYEQNGNYNNFAPASQYNQSLDKKIRRIFAIVFIIVGFILCIGGISNNITQKKKESRCTQTTRAEIIDVSSKIKRSGSRRHRTRRTYYYPTVVYEADGKSYRYLSEEGSTTSFSEGTHLVLHYNPNNPSECYIERLTKNYVTSIFSGVFMIVTGVVLIFSKPRPRRRY